MLHATERVRISIDLSRLSQNLLLPNGAVAGEGTARSFMQYAGFNLDADGMWVGPRAYLRRFNPGEVVGVEPA